MEAWLGLGGGAVYELLVGSREEDTTKLLLLKIGGVPDLGRRSKF